jgi:hypothetical protein
MEIESKRDVSEQVGASDDEWKVEDLGALVKRKKKKKRRNLLTLTIIDNCIASSIDCCFYYFFLLLLHLAYYRMEHTSISPTFMVTIFEKSSHTSIHPIKQH